MYETTISPRAGYQETGTSGSARHEARDCNARKTERNVSRDQGVPRRPGGQLGGRGTRRKNSFEARGDKQQRAEPHPDPEAAGLSPVWLREEAPFNASTA
jgi:hypothetical protein